MSHETLVLPAADPAEFSRQMRKVGDLVEQIEESPDPLARDLARQLTTAVLDLHREGLAQLWTLLEQAGDVAHPVRAACLTNPLIGNLLTLHGLHPLALEVRVGVAIDKVRPRLHLHGGDVELIGITDDAVRLKLLGKCDGCQSAKLTMRSLVETALCETAADIVSIFWDNDLLNQGSPAQGFVPLECLSQV